MKRSRRSNGVFGWLGQVVCLCAFFCGSLAHGQALVGPSGRSEWFEDRLHAVGQDEPLGDISGPLPVAGDFPPLPPDPYEEVQTPLPPLEDELWFHGGSYLYFPEGDRLGGRSLPRTNITSCCVCQRVG